MEDLKLQYKLGSFEGPLDLLLSLIAKNEIDIYDIPIALVFEQYMDYIHQMEYYDMEIASEFLVMASELMLIKSRMLLPKEVVDGVEVDPREELVRTLLEYQLAKEEAVFLSNRYSLYFGRFTKETDEVGVDKTYVADQQSVYLVEALNRLLARIKLDESMKNEDAAKTLTTIIHQRPSSVRERTGVILTALREKRKMGFLELMSSCRSRSEIIASFMAILALISAQTVIAVNNEEDAADPEIHLINDGQVDGALVEAAFADPTDNEESPKE